MKKRLIMALLVGVMTVTSAMPVFAAPKQMADGNYFDEGNYFDAEYYAENNPDVVAVVGTDGNLLYNHYVVCGKNEGRRAMSPNTVTFPFIRTTSDGYECYHTVMVYNDRGYSIKSKTYNENNGDLTSWSETTYNENNKLLRENYYQRDGSLLQWTEYEYDSRDNLVKVVHYNGDGTLSDCEDRTYDDQNHCLKMIHYSSDGNIIEWKEFERNSQGKCIKEIIYHSDGSIDKIYQYEYDSDGYVQNTIEQDGKCPVKDSEGRIFNSNVGDMDYWDSCQFDDKGNMLRGDIGSDSYEWEYDKEGNIIKETYMINNCVTAWSDYQYDIQNQQIKEVHYDILTQNDYTVEYQYDNYGNVVKYIHQSYRDFDGEKFECISECEYEYKYDEQGNVLKYTTLYNNTLFERREYEYDNQGNMMKENIYDEMGWLGVKEYDSYGNCIESIIRGSWDTYDYTYDVAGNILSIEKNGKYSKYKTKYEYDNYGNVIKYIVDNGGGDVNISEYQYKYDSNGNVLEKISIR